MLVAFAIVKTTAKLSQMEKNDFCRPILWANINHLYVLTNRRFLSFDFFTADRKIFKHE